MDTKVGITTSHQRSQSRFLKQNPSPFFRILPLEVRLLVYKHFIYSDFGRVHLLESDLDYEGGFKFNPCKGHLRNRNSALGGYYEDAECCRLGGAYETDLLSMPRTCKRVYMEMRDQLYSVPLFEMDAVCFTRVSTPLLPKWFLQIKRLSLKKEFRVGFFKLNVWYHGPQERVNKQMNQPPAERRVEVRAWDEIIDGLQSMPHLRELQLWLGAAPTDSEIGSYREDAMLGPMRRLSHVPNVSVVFMWRSMADEARMNLRHEYDIPLSWDIARLL